MITTLQFDYAAALWYWDTINFTIDTWIWRIALKKVYFEKTSFEDGHFGNGDKKQEDQITLLFLYRERDYHACVFIGSIPNFKSRTSIQDSVFKWIVSYSLDVNVGKKRIFCKFRSWPSSRINVDLATQPILKGNLHFVYSNDNS